MISNRVVILGGSGFIGSELAPTLRAEGADVITVSQHPLPADDSSHVVGSILDTAFLASLFKAGDIVIHLADSQTPATSEQDKEGVIRNARAAANSVAAAAKASLIHSLIYTSSGGTVYGEASLPLTEDSPLNPISAYGMSKVESEKVFLSFSEETGIPVTILRLANVYGRKDLSAKKPAIDIFIAKALKNEGVSVNGDGTIVRDYIWVEDVVGCIIHTISHNLVGIYNVGTQIGTSLNQALELVGSIIGTNLRVERKPRKAQDIQYNVLDITKIKSTGWEPSVTLENGMQRILQSYVIK
jgi:UDP-glucose 4-epimerase